MGGIGFLSTLGVGVGFFCPTPQVQLDHFSHHTLKLGIPVEIVQFLLKLLFQQISCCALRFPLILKAKLQSIMKESEILESQKSEILERSELESDILPPTPQPCLKSIKKFFFRYYVNRYFSMEIFSKITSIFYILRNSFHYIRELQKMKK